MVIQCPIILWCPLACTRREGRWMWCWKGWCWAAVLVVT